MQEYVIEVGMIEDLQTVRDIDQLENIFSRAKSTIVNGEKVILVRKDKSGRRDKFDELSTLEDLDSYRRKVFQYL